MQINIRGGTHAGWRQTKEQNRSDWKCPTCGARNRYYWLRCPVDGHPRPEH
jgi:rubredoxin